jgi:hypothetical protein
LQSIELTNDSLSSFIHDFSFDEVEETPQIKNKRLNANNNSKPKTKKSSKKSLTYSPNYAQNYSKKKDKNSKVRQLSHELNEDINCVKSKKMNDIMNVSGSERVFQVVWGKHKPYKKHKQWNGDGFLQINYNQRVYLFNSDGKRFRFDSILFNIIIIYFIQNLYFLTV